MKLLDGPRTVYIDGVALHLKDAGHAVEKNIWELLSNVVYGRLKHKSLGVEFLLFRRMVWRRNAIFKQYAVQ